MPVFRDGKTLGQLTSRSSIAPAEKTANRSAGASEPTAVLLVGMPYSGASALIPAFRNRDDGGKLFTVPGNEPHEAGRSATLCRLHDGFLSQLETSWDDPLPTLHKWTRSLKRVAFAAELRHIVKPLIGKTQFLIEEPRLSLLLPAWTEALSSLRCHAACVLAVGHPGDVAASLHAYDEMPVSQGLLLWLKYVLEGERETRGLPRVIVKHDEIVRDHDNVVARIGAELIVTGLAGMGRSSRHAADLAPADAPSRLEERATARESALAKLCEQAWNAISALAANAADRSAKRELDRIGRAYSEGADLFGPAVASLSRSLSEADRMRRESAELFEIGKRRGEEIAKERKARVQALTTEVAQATARAAALDTMRAAATEELARLRGEHETVVLELEQLRAAMQTLRDQALLQAGIAAEKETARQHAEQAAGKLRALLTADRFVLETEREQNRRALERSEARSTAETTRMQGEMKTIAARLALGRTALVDAHASNEHITAKSRLEIAEARSGLTTTIAGLQWQQRLTKRRQDAEADDLRETLAAVTERLRLAQSEAEQGRHHLNDAAAELVAVSAELTATTDQLEAIRRSPLRHLVRSMRRTT